MSILKNILNNFKMGFSYFLAALAFAAGLSFVEINLFSIDTLYNGSMRAAFINMFGLTYAVISTLAIIFAYKNTANGKPYGYTVLVYFVSTITAVSLATWFTGMIIDNPETNIQTEYLGVWIIINTLNLLLYTKEPL